MDFTTADKDLGYRWALELLKRGLLVNPNEKFYISIMHSDDDVDADAGHRRRSVCGTANLEERLDHDWRTIV